MEPWTELPLWMPPGQGADHAWDCDTAAAEAAGLVTRPVAETVRDTWEWLSAVGPDGVAPPREGVPGNGIDPAKERSILAAVSTTHRPPPTLP